MPRIIPRIETGLPARVTSFNHVTLRPLMLAMRSLIVCHYTGTKRKYHGLSQAEVAKVIKSINAWKPNEYNYVIDWAGRVYEFAGERRAAHASGFNDTGYGILFLNGVGEEMTDYQLYAFHFLLGMLMMGERVQAKPMIVGHQEIAATACPGKVYDRIALMREYNGHLHSLAA